MGGKKVKCNLTGITDTLTLSHLCISVTLIPLSSSSPHVHHPFYPASRFLLASVRDEQAHHLEGISVSRRIHWRPSNHHTTNYLRHSALDCRDNFLTKCHRVSFPHFRVCALVSCTGMSLLQHIQDVTPIEPESFVQFFWWINPEVKSQMSSIYCQWRNYDARVRGTEAHVSSFLIYLSIINSLKPSKESKVPCEQLCYLCVDTSGQLCKIFGKYRILVLPQQFPQSRKLFGEASDLLLTKT